MPLSSVPPGQPSNGAEIDARHIISILFRSLLSLALLLLAAEQSPQRPKPAFSSSVTLVEVDVVAIDKSSGDPVRGLRAEDFEIAEDDHPVAIATFSAVYVPAAPSEVTLPPPERSGSSFASNEADDDGRLMLIVLDDVQSTFTAGRMAIVKSVARRAVERLGPADVAGVITTSGRRGTQAEFTSDKARLLAAIDRFVPQAEHALPSIATEMPSIDAIRPQAARIAARGPQPAMPGLKVAARALATIPHRRKGVLFISQGFPGSLDAIIKGTHGNVAFDSIREFMLNAQRHNVAVYTVDPCGLESDARCTRDSRQNLRTMAEQTGGFAVVNTNQPEESVARILAENGTYYLLGYSSPAPPNDGKHHRITVRTRLPNVELRAREGYDSPSKAVQSASAAPLDALTGAATQARGLTMRVVAIPAPLATAPSAAVIVGIEIPTSVAARAGRTEFAIVAIDAEGKTRGRVTFTTNFAAAARTSSAWTRTGSRIDVPPGQYHIRVAAVGAGDLRGSVFTDVSVPQFGAELAVGGLSLGAPSAAAITGADRLRGVLPLVPLAANEIAAGASLTAQLPIRVSSRGAAHPLTIAATLAGNDGQTLTLDRTTASGRDYAVAAGKIYRVSLPDSLSEGRYRLVVETTIGRTKVAREISFTVAARK
jgi:VWFA-related protein